MQTSDENTAINTMGEAHHEGAVLGQHRTLLPWHPNMNCIPPSSVVPHSLSHGKHRGLRTLGWTAGALLNCGYFCSSKQRLSTSLRIFIYSKASSACRLIGLCQTLTKEPSYSSETPVSLPYSVLSCRAIFKLNYSAVRAVNIVSWE